MIKWVQKFIVTYDRKTQFVLLFVIMVIAKLFQFNFLPSKYFNDSNTVLKYMVDMPDYVDISYRFTTNMYKFINLFGFKTLLQWAVFLTLIIGSFIFILIKKIRKLSLFEFIFLCCSLFLIGVYVFNIGKEPIQMVFFAIMGFLVVSKRIKSVHIRVGLIGFVMLLESLIFRLYFAFVAMLFVTLYLETVIFKIEYKKFYKFVAGNVALLFLIVLLVKIVSTETYMSIITVRYTSNQFRIGSASAQSIILDWVHIGNDYLNWCVNYAINMFRMMVPLELLLIGLGYAPFVVYQIFTLVLYVKSFYRMKNMGIEYKLMFWIFTAFIAVSIIFEPDFGSWVRHEMAAFPITVRLFFKEQKKININSEQTVLNH